MKIIHAIGFFVIFLFVIFFTIKKETYYLTPKNAVDSDETNTSDIISSIENGYEIVSLKANPFGYVEISNFTSKTIVTNVYAEFEWKAYNHSRANNIYIGYSFGDNYKEFGPFGDSGIHAIRIPVNIFTDFSKLKLRIRGENSDFSSDALLEVKIRLQVTGLKIL